MIHGLFKIEGMTIAVSNMQAMLLFYRKVFNIDFNELDMYNSKLYSSQWCGINLLFCPAEIASNTADQNRHQLDILVPDLNQLLILVKKYGGEVMADIIEEDNVISVGVYDPDKNSILFKQYL